MGFLRRQEQASERTPEQRAHARAVREARRKGLPEPPAPAPAPDAEAEAEDALPPEVEPAAARLPEPESEPEPEAKAAPEPEPEPEPAPVGAPLTWDVTEEWEAVGEHDRPHGDPLAPETAPQAEPDEEAEAADPPHGDPLVPQDDDPPPAAAAGLPRAPSLADGNGGRRARSGQALGRDLPPLPPRTAAREAPAPPPAPRRRRRWGRRIVAFGALMVVGAAVVLAVALFQPFHGSGTGGVRVTIPSGSTSREIGDLLARSGVVADGRLFALRAALAGKRGDFKSGGFTLKGGMSYSAAIDALTTAPGAAPTVRVTISEGRARRETAPLLAQAGISGDYVKATSVRPPRDLSAARGTKSLEGFLFPATYELPKRAATADELVAEQLKSFRANITKVDFAHAKRKNLTRYDVLTIASMVEREAQLPRERRLIAAVIYNRLHEGIPLSIDATIRYAVHNWTRPLRVSELNVDSPYNLRKHTGLPPTPIGSPGLAAIQAAANPAHVPYLYYVVKPGGHGAHAFSSTDAQFQRDVRRYNLARARNGGRSPAG